MLLNRDTVALGCHSLTCGPFMRVSRLPRSSLSPPRSVIVITLRAAGYFPSPPSLPTLPPVVRPNSVAGGDGSLRSGEWGAYSGSSRLVASRALVLGRERMAQEPRASIPNTPERCASETGTHPSTPDHTDGSPALLPTRQRLNPG